MVTSPYEWKILKRDEKHQTINQSSIFHSYGDVTIAGEGLQILTYTRHSRPLSSEGSFTCHTYCDTGHPFLRSSPRTHDIRTRDSRTAERLAVELSLPVFTNTRTSAWEANALPLRHGRGLTLMCKRACGYNHEILTYFIKDLATIVNMDW